MYIQGVINLKEKFKDFSYSVRKSPLKKINNKNINYIFLLILLLSPFFTYILLLFTKYIGTLYIDPKFKLGSIDAWIGFLGSIVGSVITILVLVNTINRDSEKEIKDEARRNQPYIHIIPKANDEYKIEIKNNQNYHSEIYPISLRLKNLTSNPAKDIELISQTSEIYNSDSNSFVPFSPYDEDDSKYYQLYIVLVDDRKFIEGNKEDNYHLNFYIYDLDYSPSETFRINIKISYRDVLDIVEYEHSYTIEILLNISNQNLPIIWAKNISSKITKITYLL